MRLCLPARMGGGGKAESLPWRGPADATRPPHGGRLFCFGKREGEALGVPNNKRNRAGQAPISRDAATITAPLHGATQRGGVRAQPCASAHRARREARMPAGQLKDSAPSRSAAGKSATLKTPAHYPTLLIVTRRAKTTGLVRAAHRAGCRQAAPIT